MSWPTYMYHRMFLNTRIKNMYRLKVKISTVIFAYILFQEDRISPQFHSLHTIRCPLTQKTRIPMFKGWQTQRFSRYVGTFYRGWNITPYCHGLNSNKNILWCMGGDVNGFQDIRAALLDGTNPYGHGLHTIRCNMTQKTRLY
jgi:hypothetical protein